MLTLTCWRPSPLPSVRSDCTGCYDTPTGPAIVHLDGHLQRLMDSCKIYRIAPEYTAEELAAACKEVVKANGLGSCYIRPMVLRGYGATGMDGIGSPIGAFLLLQFHLNGMYMH